MQHVDHLDGWRGVAISSVLFAHFTDIYSFDFGRLGVDLFFVLSGLLMSRILYERRVPLKTFYWRRTSRILPVFLLFLAVVYVFAALRELEWTSSEIIASALFLRTYLPAEISIWNTAVPANHLWSLNVEEHSYIALALIAAVPVLRGREGWALLALAGACAAMIIWYWRTPETSPADYMLRTETAALGLVAAASYHRLKPHTERYVRAWMPLVALAIGISCYAAMLPDVIKTLIAPGCLAFAVNHIGSTYRWAVRALEWKPLRLLGVWSYSLYLWQQPFYALQDDLVPAVALALAIGVGVCSYYFFESPVRRWLNNRHAPAPAALTATT